jgi:hypothetical protein
LRWDNPEAVRWRFNAVMALRMRTLTDEERTSLLRYETLYAQWRAAVQALSASELALWAEALRAPTSEVRMRLAAETLSLRQAAADAHAQLIAALDEGEAQTRETPTAAR